MVLPIVIGGRIDAVAEQVSGRLAATAACRRGGSRSRRGRTPTPRRPRPCRPLGLPPTSIVSSTSARIRREPQHHAVAGVRHPDPALSDGDRARVGADLDRARDRVGFGIDSRDGAVDRGWRPRLPLRRTRRCRGRCRPRSPPTPCPSPARRGPRVPAASSVTHSDPAPAAIAVGLEPTGSPVGHLAAGEVDSHDLAVDRRQHPDVAPNATATPRGPFPTSSDPTIRLAPGSTWSTVPSVASATQANPAPVAMPAGSPPTSIVAT